MLEKFIRNGEVKLVRRKEREKNRICGMKLEL
jgi:hypothetical protein